jgi:hypothetical protein
MINKYELSTNYYNKFMEKQLLLSFRMVYWNNPLEKEVEEHSWCQFHQHFKRTYKSLFSSFSLLWVWLWTNFCTKNAHLKCWWNWRQPINEKSNDCGAVGCFLAGIRVIISKKSNFYSPLGPTFNKHNFSHFLPLIYSNSLFLLSRLFPFPFYGCCVSIFFCKHSVFI